MSKILLVILSLVFFSSCTEMLDDNSSYNYESKTNNTSISHDEEIETKVIDSSEPDEEIYYCPDKTANDFINDYNRNNENIISGEDISYIETGAGYETTISFKTMNFVIGCSDGMPSCSFVGKLPYSLENKNEFFKEIKKPLQTFIQIDNETFDGLTQELKSGNYPSETKTTIDKWRFIYEEEGVYCRDYNSDYVLHFFFMTY